MYLYFSLLVLIYILKRKYLKDMVPQKIAQTQKHQDLEIHLLGNDFKFILLILIILISKRNHFHCKQFSN